LAGVRIRLDLSNGQTVDPQQFYESLLGLRADFVELSVDTPIPGSKKYYEYRRRGLLLTEDYDLYNRHTPVVRTSLDSKVFTDLIDSVRDRFYSWDAIITRSIRTFSHVGIYNTFLYNFSTNLAYRENLLERAGYPP